MEERYEIRGKIGQGGLGAVYRGFDTRMNREIAIKRISVNEEDPALKEESTKQLMQEAGALASLQHPHIVTVYDVGSDEDGPYVVMELINGKTLDELIENAPLTWNDFRELALQTEEALIAAQELDLIHSDIKPSNLMLTWLPSGKFQMKIVDFGLATLTQSQSLEELEEIEAVFGSIFFMAPEQFERKPIDARVDMYAMGCVYYQALAGMYPFQGETGHDVMVSHLHHRVVPLQDVRSDIPLWACDWIMWHINRNPDDRPESARQALQVFLQNDKNPAPTMSLGTAKPTQPLGPRPRLSIPASTGVKRRVIDPRMAPPDYVPPPPPPEPVPVATQVIAAPPAQPLMPPEGFKPSIHTGPHEIPDALPVAATVPLNPAPYVAPSRRYVPVPKKKKRNMGLQILLIILGLGVLAAAGLVLSNRLKQSGGNQRAQILLTQGADAAITEIPMSGTELAGFLDQAANADTEEQREKIYQVLIKARPNDNVDFEATLTDFATKSTQILPEVRESLITKVLTPRVNAAMVAPLTDFARSTNDSKSAVAALNAIRTWALDNQFEAFLSVAQYHDNADVRTAAGQVASEILKKSRRRAELVNKVEAAIAETSNAKVREVLLRITNPS